MRAVALRLELSARAFECRRVGKRAQQFVMAAAWFVRARKQHVDHAQAGARTNAPGRHTIAGTDDAVVPCGSFERSHHRRADRDDALRVRPRLTDGEGGGFRDAIGLVEWQAQVELGVSRRRDTGGVCNGGKADAPVAHRSQRSPVQRKACRRRLEGDREPCDWSPYVPQRDRLRHVRVLDGPPVASKTGPDAVRRAVE